MRNNIIFSLVFAAFIVSLGSLLEPGSDRLFQTPSVTPGKNPIPPADNQSLISSSDSNLPSSSLPSSVASPLPAGISPSIKWGAYAGWQKNAMAEFEAKIGKKADIAATFVHWGNESGFPKQWTDSDLKSQNKTLVIFWEAMDYNKDINNQPEFSYDNILKGDWNDYFKSFALEAKAYEWPVILIPFEEMNGDWYPWSGVKNSNSPSKHIAAYRYVRGFFNNVPNVKFGWCVNNESIPNTAENKIENYYPGDRYVDYVGVNGFNFGSPWQSFSEIFDNALSRLEKFNKPAYIFSMASAPGSKKAQWISDALKVQIPKHPKLEGWVWFNENKEEDWMIWSNEESLEAFKNGLNR